jgi:hypothetical protein
MENGAASKEKGQFAELAAAVVQQLPRDMDATTSQNWITNRGSLQRILREALMPAEKKADEPQNAWQRKFTVFERELLATLALVRDLKRHGSAKDWEMLLGQCHVSLDAQFQNVLHQR